MNAKSNLSRRRLQLPYVIWFLCVASAIAWITRPMIVVAEEATVESAKVDAPVDASGVRRPDRPSWVADPREFKVSLDDNDRVPPFNFVGQPWPDVLQWLATISECSLDWQELPKDYLNLTTQKSHSVAEVRDLLNRHLSARGYTILDRDKVLSVFKIDALDPNLVPKTSEEELYNRNRYDFVKVTFKLPAGAIAEDFAADAKEVLSPHAVIVPLASSNRLLVMDTVVNLRGLADLLREEQSASDESLREFVLHHTRAELIVGMLYQIVGDGSMAPSSPENEERQQERQKMVERMRRRGLNPEALIDQEGPQGIHLALNRRRNSILVNAPPAQMRILQRAIEALDVPQANAVVNSDAIGPEEKYVERYALATTSLETMVQTLNDIGGLGPGAEIRGDSSTRSLIVLANKTDHEKIAGLIKRLDGVGRKFEVVPLRRLAADAVAVTIYHLMVGPESEARQEQQQGRDRTNQDKGNNSDSGFRVDADVENNRLLLWANESELVEVRALLAKLGEVPGQNDRQTVRVLGPFKSTPPRKVLEQIKGVWSSFSDGELIINESKDDSASEQAPPTADEPTGDDSAGAHSPGESDLQASGSGLNLLPEGRRVNYASAQFADLRVTAQTNAGEDPLNVTVTEDGRVILNSNDPDALDAFEKLLKVYSPPESRFRVFRLQHARAYPVWLNLKEYFAEELGLNEESATDKTTDEKAPLTIGQPATGLSQRRKLHIIYDTPSNSILVANASPAQLAEMQELIDEYDQPAPAKSIKARRTAAIKVHNSSAATIAAALKEVYRDLLSSRDKEFETEDAKLIGTASEAPTIIHYGVSDADSPIGKQTEPVKVRFDGSLSVGVDEAANMLIISAQDELFDSIVDTIAQLDAAIPRQTVRVHAIRGGMSGTALSNALSAALDTQVNVRRPQQSEQVQSQQTDAQQQAVVQPKPKVVREPKANSPADKDNQPGIGNAGGTRSASSTASGDKASEGNNKGTRATE